MGTATTVQTHWKWYQNNADANAATEAAAEDTWFEPTLDTTYFLRIKVENSGNKNEDSQTYQLQYSQNGGTWTNVTTTSNFVRAVTGGDTDGDAMTELLTKTVSGYTNGEHSTDGVTAAMVINQDNSTEHVYAVQFRSADITDGVFLELRLVGGGAALDGTYNLAEAIVAHTPTQGVLNLRGTETLPIERYYTIATQTQGVLNAVGHQPTVQTESGQVETTVNPTHGVINAVGQTPTVTKTRKSDPTHGVINAVGQTPTVTKTRQAFPAHGVLNAQGHAPTVDRVKEASPSQGVLNQQLPRLGRHFLLKVF
jgi:hypothetical protein